MKVLSSSIPSLIPLFLPGPSNSSCPRVSDLPSPVSGKLLFPLPVVLHKRILASQLLKLLLCILLGAVFHIGVMHRGLQCHHQPVAPNKLTRKRGEAPCSPTPCWRCPRSCRGCCPWGWTWRGCFPWRFARRCCRGFGRPLGWGGAGWGGVDVGFFWGGMDVDEFVSWEGRGCSHSGADIDDSKSNNDDVGRPGD